MSYCSKDGFLTAALYKAAVKQRLIVIVGFTANQFFQLVSVKRQNPSRVPKKHAALTK
jgi:hypothetical protein